jgi:hypothetical protein
MPNTLSRILSLLTAALVLAATQAFTTLGQSGNGQGKGQNQSQNQGQGSTPGGKQSQAQGDGATAGIEPITLAYNGLSGNALKIAKRIDALSLNSSVMTRIIILDHATLDDLIGFQVALAEISILHSQICAYEPEPGPGGGATGGTGILSDVGSVISATASLVQALTPDATASDSAFTISDELLVTETIKAIRLKHPAYQLLWPKQYLKFSNLDVNRSAPDADSCANTPPRDFLDAYRTLMDSYSDAQQWLLSGDLNSDQKSALKAILSRVDRLRNDLEASQSKSASEQTNSNSQSGQDQNSGDSSDASGTGPSQGKTASTPPSQAATAPLLRFVRIQSFYADALQSCSSGTSVNCYLLYLRSGPAAGGSIVKKSFFHPTFFYYSGGAVSSYALISFGTGAIESSGTLTTVTNYMREKTFRKEFGTERRYDSKSDKEMDNQKDGDDAY